MESLAWIALFFFLFSGADAIFVYMRRRQELKHEERIARIKAGNLPKELPADTSIEERLQVLETIVTEDDRALSEKLKRLK